MCAQWPALLALQLGLHLHWWQGGRLKLTAGHWQAPYWLTY
jgi:hypothetical protein